MQIRISKALELGEGENKKKVSVTVTPKDGAPYEAIDAKVDNLTGGDVGFCLAEATAAKGQPILMPRFDIDFQIQVIAKTSGIEAAAFKKLSMSDYLEVAQAAQGFLTGSG